MEENSKFEFIRINSDNKQLDLLSDFHQNICKSSFNEHELESFDIWKYELENDFMTFFILVLFDNKVVGGLAYEVYTNSACIMITYVAIDKNFRGTGLSKILINEAIKDINALNISIILIEVIIPEDQNGINRQKIWTKLNFTPTDIVYTHPAYLKWKPYQIAVYNPNQIENLTIDLKTIELFLIEYFNHIIKNNIDNNNDDDKSEINSVILILHKIINDVIIANNSKWKDSVTKLPRIASLTLE